jgi:CHAD domain-containing protein
VSKRYIRSHLVKQLRNAAKAATLMASVMRQGGAAALHDLRVQVRTVASVLHPFLGLPHAKPLRRCLEPLRSWVRKSNRARDAEAQLELIEELLSEPYPWDVVAYLARMEKELRHRRAALAQSKSLVKLPRRIARLARAADECLDQFSATALVGAVNRACEELLADLRMDCAQGLQDPKHWHQARLRIKQLRYLIDCFGGFLDARFLEFAADTKRAQENLGRLRDWQNLRAAMAGEPIMAQWLAEHAALEDELATRAKEAMDFLARKLDGQD